jgi:hypothetical protein
MVTVDSPLSLRAPFDRLRVNGPGKTLLKNSVFRLLKKISEARRAYFAYG